MPEKVLVTGNEGFIGRHLKLAGFTEGMDLKNGEDVCNGITGDYSAVINCAAEMFSQSDMLKNNVMATEKVARYCREWGAKLVHLTTVAIFGGGYYGLTKKMGEMMVEHICPPAYCLLRLTNVYGEGGTSPANRFENGETTIFGTGDHVKDLVHVRDVVAAIKMALEEDWRGEVHISSGKPATINQIFERFGKGKPIYLADRKPDIEISTLDNSRALSLGWKPTWTYDRAE